MATWHPENPTRPFETATDSADLPVFLFRRLVLHQKLPASRLPGRPPGQGRRWGQPAQWPDHAAEFWKNCRRSPGDDSVLHLRWWGEETTSPAARLRVVLHPCERPPADGRGCQDLLH